MLDLNSPRWSELQHAYGKATDIPNLLRELDSLPAGDDITEPWFSLWSSLAHQGDVYGASFAAVPHVVRSLATAPAKASANYFHFPAWIEICRHRTNSAIPEDLLSAYTEALGKLPGLVAAAAVREWDDDFLRSALAAIAASKNSIDVAEATMELTPSVAKDFLGWFVAK